MSNIKLTSRTYIAHRLLPNGPKVVVVVMGPNRKTDIGFMQ